MEGDDKEPGGIIPANDNNRANGEPNADRWQRIAADLNCDGIPSPTGKRWGDTTIRGNYEIGSGMLNCELYVGRLVWNRQRKVKNPDTGRCAHRLNPQGKWFHAEARERRIAPQALWDAAKTRQAHLSDVFAGRIEGTRTAMRVPMVKNGGLNASHRPRILLSGLLFCGYCRGTYRRRDHDRYVGTSHVLGNGCDFQHCLLKHLPGDAGAVDQLPMLVRQGPAAVSAS